MKEVSYLNFTNHHIYVGLDVHHKQWNVSIISGNILLGRMSREPNTASLVKYLRTNYPGSEYHCVYEAGFCGFWPYYELTEAGIDCIVVNPADVPTTHKEKDRKNDKVDSRKLARSLSNGELEGIQILDPQSYEDRGLLRTREALVKDQTRCKNRIKGLMKFFKIEVKDKDIKSHWSNKYINYLEQIDTMDVNLKTSLISYLGQLRHLRKTISEVTKQIRSLAKTEKYSKNVELLCSIPGISILSAMILQLEIGDIGLFRNSEKLRSYVGLVPSEHSSDEKKSQNHMTRRGKGILKKTVIEASWTAIRKDPGLLMVYENLLKRVRGSRAIITIARKMIGRIMFVLNNNEPYKFLQIK